MIAAWMLYSLVVGGLFAVAGWAAERAVRLLRLPSRWIPLSALLATSFLSFLALFRLLTADPTPPIDLPAGGIAAGTAGTAPGSHGVWAWPGAAAGALAGIAEQIFEAVASLVPDGRPLAIAWTLASLALLMLGFATLRRLQRERRDWREHRLSGTEVLVSRGFGPALVGLLRPAIVVPPWLLDRPAESQALVVQHEEEHRRARDPLLLGAACLAVALLPWNPALWWLLRRTRLAVELDCDARVLRRGVAPLSYGTLLLEVAGHPAPRYLLTPAISGSPLHLERRLLAMSTKSLAPLRARAGAAGVGSIALVLGALACGTDVPTAVAVEELDVAAAQAQAEHVGLLPAGESRERTPFFVLDGRPVSEAEIKALSPEQIASIDVLKGPAAIAAYGAPGEHGVIRVRSNTAAAAGATPERMELRAGNVELDLPDRVILRRAHAGTDTVIHVRQGSLTADTTYRVNPEAKPLLVIDGKVVPNDRLSEVPPESIESISVLKNELAVAQFGERGKNGVIIITRKPAARR